MFLVTTKVNQIIKSVNAATCGMHRAEVKIRKQEEKHSSKNLITTFQIDTQD